MAKKISSTSSDPKTKRCHKMRNHLKTKVRESDKNLKARLDKEMDEYFQRGKDSATVNSNSTTQSSAPLTRQWKRVEFKENPKASKPVLFRTNENHASLTKQNNKTDAQHQKRILDKDLDDYFKNQPEKTNKISSKDSASNEKENVDTSNSVNIGDMDMEEWIDYVLSF